MSVLTNTLVYSYPFTCVEGSTDALASLIRIMTAEKVQRGGEFKSLYINHSTLKVPVLFFE